MICKQALVQMTGSWSANRVYLMAQAAGFKIMRGTALAFLRTNGSGTETQPRTTSRTTSRTGTVPVRPPTTPVNDEGSREKENPPYGGQKKEKRRRVVPSVPLVDFGEHEPLVSALLAAEASWKGQEGFLPATVANMRFALSAALTERGIDAWLYAAREATRAGKGTSWFYAVLKNFDPSKISARTGERTTSPQPKLSPEYAAMQQRLLEREH